MIKVPIETTPFFSKESASCSGCRIRTLHQIHVLYLSQQLFAEHFVGGNAQSCALFVRSYQQIYKSNDEQNSNYRSDSKTAADEQVTDLINAQGYNIGKQCLISDCSEKTIWYCSSHV